MVEADELRTTPRHPCPSFGFGLSDMLINQNLISVGVTHDDEGGTGRLLIAWGLQRNPLLFQSALNRADIIKVGNRFGRSVPARVIRQHVLREHALEQADRA